MRSTAKTLFTLTAIFLASFFYRVYAQDEFRTEYDIHYDIGANTETLVTQTIRITNLKSDVIATNYTLTVKQMRIYDVQATDSKGNMEIEEVMEAGSTSIKTQFNENIVGEGRTNTVTIKYKTRDLATKLGEIYTLKIPKVAGLDDVREYNVKLSVPESFGPNIFITPEANTFDMDKGKYIYNFRKEELENRGISASFGKYQIMNYRLKYQLKNDSFLSNVQEIALPPDIKDRQQVDHKSLNPEPVKVYEDKDGNLIAQYKVKPRELLEIELVGSVRIIGRQITPEFGGTFEDIPEGLRKSYTKEQKYWEVNSPEIQQIKTKLMDKELSVSENALNIYNFVIDNLTYDFGVIDKESVERHGALQALLKESPSACMEFTDLFITLSRAMGIPARELNGYAMNIYEKYDLPLSIKFKSGDLLHSWPEYYDPSFGWVPVDPTWGHTSKLDFFTKLDNSHFAFVVKGTSSEYPLAAGVQRVDEATKLVSVDISQNYDDSQFGQYASLYKAYSFNPIETFKGNRRYLVKNDGGTYIYNLYGKKILPYEVASIYAPKNVNILRFEDMNGELSSSPAVFLEKNPKRYFLSPAYLILSTVLGTALCSFLYYLIAVKGFPKKALSRLKRRPQDQGQKRNRSF